MSKYGIKIGNTTEMRVGLEEAEMPEPHLNSEELFVSFRNFSSLFEGGEIFKLLEVFKPNQPHAFSSAEFSAAVKI